MESSLPRARESVHATERGNIPIRNASPDLEDAGHGQIVRTSSGSTFQPIGYLH